MIILVRQELYLYLRIVWMAESGRSATNSYLVICDLLVGKKQQFQSSLFDQGVRW